MNPRVIFLLLRFGIILLPALIALFARMGRGMGVSPKVRLPPPPSEDIGKRPLMNRLPPANPAAP